MDYWARCRRWRGSTDMNSHSIPVFIAKVWILVQRMFRDNRKHVFNKNTAKIQAQKTLSIRYHRLCSWVPRKSYVEYQLKRWTTDNGCCRKTTLPTNSADIHQGRSTNCPHQARASVSKRVIGIFQEWRSDRYETITKWKSAGKVEWSESKVMHRWVRGRGKPIR